MNERARSARWWGVNVHALESTCQCGTITAQRVMYVMRTCRAVEFHLRCVLCTVPVCFAHQHVERHFRFHAFLSRNQRNHQKAAPFSMNLTPSEILGYCQLKCVLQTEKEAGTCRILSSSSVQGALTCGNVIALLSGGTGSKWVFSSADSAHHQMALCVTSFTSVKHKGSHGEHTVSAQLL